MATTAKIPATTQFGYLGDRLQVYLGNGSWRNPTAAEITAFKGSPTTYKQVNAQGRPLTIAQSTTQQQQLQAQAAEAQRRAQLTQQQQMAELQARQRAEALATQQRLAQEAAAQQAEQARIAQAAEAQRQAQLAERARQAQLAEQQRIAQQQAAAKPVIQPPVVQLPPNYTQPVAPPAIQPPVQQPAPLPQPAPNPIQQPVQTPIVISDPDSAAIGNPYASGGPIQPTAPVTPTAPAMDPAWESAFAKWKANNAAWQQKFLAGNQTAQTTPVTIAPNQTTGINAFAGPVV